MMRYNMIYFEDCLEGMKKIPDESIDAVICDLPYGTTACSWDTILPWDKLWAAYLRVTKKNSPIVLFGVEPFSTMLRMSNFKQYKYDWYWVKNNVTGFAFAKTQPMRCVETISIFSKGTPNYYPQGLMKLSSPKLAKRKEYKENVYSNDGSLSGKQFIQTMTGYPNNVLKFSKETKHTFHPTQKPVSLLEYLVKTYSQPGEVILDNCMGSGTTAIACLNTNRQFIGFETNEEYYRKSLERIRENCTQLSLF